MDKISENDVCARPCIISLQKAKNSTVSIEIRLKVVFFGPHLLSFLIFSI